MNKLFSILIIIILFNYSCATLQRQENNNYSSGNYSEDYQDFVKYKKDSSTLGPGDVFEIKIYMHPEISGDFMVFSNGTINYPLLGTINIENKTPQEIAHIIKSKLEEKYLNNPQVTIFVKAYNSKKIFIQGEVNKQGAYTYEDKMTIIHAVALAGGFTKLAAKNRVIVTRVLSNGDVKMIKVPVAEIGKGVEKNLTLQPGDMINVPESFF